jgi:hypothetical protein
MDQDFTKAFSNLRQNVLPLLERNTQLVKRSSPAFDPLGLLGIAELERTHSKILADLLDPLGSHAQNDFFLKEFIEHFQLCDSTSAREFGGIQVEAEYPIRGGRLDLLIRMPSKFVIVLENKVSSSEGEEQLKKYGAWLAKQSEPVKRLLYLTPKGEDSTPISEQPDRWLSYESDISAWLASCLEKLKQNPSLYGFLLVYLKRVRTLGGEIVSAIDKDLVAALLKSDNVDTAYAVWQAFDESVRQLHLKFWKQTLDKVREGLRAMGIRGWKASLESDDDLLTGKYPKLKLEPTGSSEDDLYYRFILERNPKYETYYGVCSSQQVWKKATNDQLLQHMPAFKMLEQSLREDDFRASQPWWLGYKYLSIDLRDKSNIIQLAKNRNLQVRVADHLLSTFEKYQRPVETLNAALPTES